VASGSRRSRSCSEWYSRRARTAADSPVSADASRVGPADVADEQRVPGQDAVRDPVARMLVHDEADRLRRVAGRGQHLDRHLAQREPLTVGQQLRRERDVRAGPEAHGRAGTGPDLEVAGHEVGVDVGQDDPFDREAPGRRLVQVHADVAPGVDHDGPAGGLVADHVRGLRQAGEVVLAEDHRKVPAGCGTIRRYGRGAFQPSG
jgi:hypothetical protein